MTATARPACDRESPLGPAASHDADLVRDAEARLRRSGYRALHDVSCDGHEGWVRLGGRLPSHYLKQVAQELAAEVEGVSGVINLIRVVAPADRARPWDRA